VPAKNEQLIGAFASSLDWEQKLALLLTPNRYHEYKEESTLLKDWLIRGRITEEEYLMMHYEHPTHSLYAKYARLGTASWARQVVEMGDPTTMVAPGSLVLGIEAETNDPVLKKERGIPAHTLSEMLQKSDIRASKVAPAPEPRQVAAAVGDEVEVDLFDIDF